MKKSPQNSDANLKVKSKNKNETFVVNRIAEIMKAKNITAKEIVYHKKIDQNLVYRIINNKNKLIRPEIYQKIADYLGVSYHELFLVEEGKSEKEKEKQQQQQNLESLKEKKEQYEQYERIVNLIASNNIDIRIAISFIEETIDKTLELEKAIAQTQKELQNINRDIEEKFLLIHEKLIKLHKDLKNMSSLSPVS